MPRSEQHATRNELNRPFQLILSLTAKLAAMVDFDRKALSQLCKEHDVVRLRIFGSAARGEERPESDVDLIVDFRVPKGLLEIVRLERRLGEIFGRSVDLVTESGLSPYLRDTVLASSLVIFDAAA